MSDFSKLIAAHNGDMALLYIWLKENGAFSLENAARDLCMPVKRVETALEMLKLYGLETPSKGVESIVPLPQKKALESERKYPEDGIHIYTSEELTELSEKDSVFASLKSESEACLGKILSKDDLIKLVDMYQHLGMDPQVIVVLLHYSKSIADKTRLSMYNINKRAYAWNDMGLDTVEKAEQYVENRRKAEKRESKIKSILKVDYDLTPKQREMVERWIDCSYSDESIRQAYEITLEKTNKLAWSYLDKVLQNRAKEESSQTVKNDSPYKGRPLPDHI